jgi:hypothetical protein
MEAATAATDTGTGASTGKDSVSVSGALELCEPDPVSVRLCVRDSDSLECCAAIVFPFAAASALVFALATASEGVGMVPPNGMRSSACSENPSANSGLSAVRVAV